MTLTVTSPSNPLIKRLKSLHLKKGRAETGLFLAEGARLAAEASDLGVWPQTLVYAPEAMERTQVRKLVAGAHAQGVQLIQTSSRLMADICKRDNPQTVIGAYRQNLVGLTALPPTQVTVALERVRDPGNLGTILRTADAVGAGGVILVGPSCDPFSVEAVRASMGSIFAVPLARAEPDELFAFATARGARVVGTSLKATHPHDGVPIDRPVVLLMGNEQSGLPEEMEARCDALVKIPMRGRADSLNLAISTAVMLYDLWRRAGYEA